MNFLWKKTIILSKALFYGHLALRESTRAVAKNSPTTENGTTSPIPEAEETHKYVENVMTRSARSDIFSQARSVLRSVVNIYLG